MERFARTKALLGDGAMLRLSSAHVAIFGLGGVGGSAFETLVRMGVGHLTIIDCDVFSESNLNRQLLATEETVGMKKVEAAKKRALSINPNVVIDARHERFLSSEESELDFSKFDYVVDAIDTVPGKLAIAKECQKLGIPLIASMGCGNRIDPTALRIGDLFKTEMDPLAKVMRSAARKAGIKKLRVVYSLEKPLTPVQPIEGLPGDKKNPPASTALVPPAAGIMMAYEVIKSLIASLPSADRC